DMAPRFRRDPAATYHVWDCITAAWLIDPSIVTSSEALPISVDTTFGPTYGETRVSDRTSREVRPITVMLDLDVERFYQIYAGLLTRPM
ncbi:uncharacterized protein METZ01_LOCUS236785, partial [marine metagenome]